MGSPAGSIQLGLFQAARIGGCARLDRLLEDGADVNACDVWGCTPLYYACCAGHADAARVLLEAGAVFTERAKAERCYNAALKFGMRRFLRSYELPPPPPLAPFPAALRSAFLACPANNRAGAKSTPTDVAGAELWRVPLPPDITLYVEGRPIEAHRVILAARSPYFRAKLAAEWRNRKEVTLTLSSSHSLSFELMYTLVDFFYSDRVEVPADDLQDLASICRDCKCEGILELVYRSIDRKTSQEYPQRRFLLKGHRAPDRLPSALRRVLQDCLANSSSREEEEETDHHNDDEPAETSCRSSSQYDDLADVCIKVGDRVFRCHQLLLGLRSEYFKTRLSRQSDFLERHCDAGELPLLEEHDVSAQAFEKMLEYVYTDEIEHLGGDDEDPLTLAEELLDVASRYLMFGLKRVVADLLLPPLDLDRLPPAELCRWLMLSDMYDAAKLRGHCLDAIARNLEAFAEAREFRALLPPDGHGDLYNDLRQRWLALRLDRTDESAALFDEMLLLDAEQEANDDDSSNV